MVFNSVKSKFCAVLIPYFGPLPSYFPVYLKGCESNPRIDFILFSDQDFLGYSLPKNVTTYKFTFKQIINLIEEKLGHTCCISGSYKLCDYKPMYGRIFFEYIENYEYWGFGDIDLVYGDIQNYIHEKHHLGYDVISFKRSWVSGSLMIIKNNILTINLYQKSKNLREVLKNFNHLGFDECFGLHKYYENSNDILACFPEKQCFTKLILEATKRNELKSDFTNAVKEWLFPQEFIEVNFINKRVTSLMSNQSFPYYHYVCDKGRPYFIFRKLIYAIPDSIYINRCGLYLPQQYGHKFFRHVITYYRFFVFSTIEIIRKIIRKKGAIV